MTADAQILYALRNAGDEHVSGADLAEKLGISRAAVWARIEDLRKLGYDIHASPHGGYTLRFAPDLLNGDDLMAMVGPDSIIGRDIRVFEQTTSTNDLIDKLGRDGVKEGVVIFAESQSKGRGRLGRNWVSPKGKGLWFSILLRPPFPPQAATRITVCAATAVSRAIRNKTNLPAEIKWPNDILIRGKKVCGILTELSAELEKIKYIVLGIGLDVNFTSSDFSPELTPIATSLKIESGQEIARAELAAEILSQFNHDYQQVLSGNFETVADEWEHHCCTIGRQVEISTGDRRFEGRAESLDAEGALIVRTQHGHLERIIGGDVSLKS
ncbi:MAG: biotin--[acetyl-CoA-carboxylase] ligase [Verrucomicrobia bacterium SCN 57-15]|nr:MAG: biotin--[acetyl-CoA-carboxylase] ligase [Verrucomicrobia bacterium SCN 57-15]